MHSFRTVSALFVSLALCALPGLAETGEAQAKETALDFGRALTRGRPSELRSILPDQGRIRLRLLHLGPEEGSYSPDQVEALFNDFLLEGKVRSFDLVRMQCSDDRFALIDARLQLVDREGRAQESGLHITLQPEQSRWVLREIRENSP